MITNFLLSIFQDARNLQRLIAVTMLYIKKQADGEKIIFPI